MNIDSIISILIIANAFVMGALVIIGVRHAIMHYRSQDEDRPQRPKAQVIQIPSSLKDKLIESSESHFQTVLNRSATTLERDLKSTTSKLTKQLDKTGSEIILTEMKRYKDDLETMRKQAESIIESVQREVVDHQGKLKEEMAQKQLELETKLKAEIETERLQLKAKLDNNLSDVVSAFLIEALKHEVDLGAQSKYLTKVLEEHKTELIKEVMDEA